MPVEGDGFLVKPESDKVRFTDRRRKDPVSVFKTCVVLLSDASTGPAASVLPEKLQRRHGCQDLGAEGTQTRRVHGSKHAPPFPEGSKGVCPVQLPLGLVLAKPPHRLLSSHRRVPTTEGDNLLRVSDRRKRDFHPVLGEGC